jgi:hypothetical protein
VFTNFCKNSQIVDVVTVSGIFAALVVACIIAVAVSVGFPGVVVFSDVVFIPAVAEVSVVAVVPAVDGVFAFANFADNHGVYMLL